MKIPPKPIKSYTEVAEYDGKKLEITLNVFKDPIFDKGPVVHTHLSITHHGKPWGVQFFSEPVEDEHLERTMKEIKHNLPGYKIKSGPHELN